MVHNTASTTPADVFRDLAEERPIAISIGSDYLTGSVAVPPAPMAVVLIANDVGCSRQRSGERDLARELRRAGLATVLVDVLMPSEQAWPEVAALLRQKVELLAKRIEAGREWIRRQPQLAALPVVLLGSGGAGPGCLLAAAARPRQLAAVVVRSSRPDLAGMALARIHTPVMLCIADGQVADLRGNRAAFDLLDCGHRLLFVRGRSLDAPEAREQLANAVAAFTHSRLGVRCAA